MNTKRFWTQLAERAVKTIAQTAIAMLGASGVGLLDVDWANLANLGSVVGLAALLSVLSSIASTKVGSGDTPSLVDVR